MPKLTAIAARLFQQQPVWETAHLDAAILAEWQKESHETQKDYGVLATGRNKLANLVDWVKANFTTHGQTFTVTRNGKEYRIWCGAIGSLDSAGAITPVSHLVHVVRALLNDEE